MANSRSYFHDHLVLLLLSVSGFLAFFGSVYFIIRIASSHGSAFIVQFRSILGINAFKPGSLMDMLAFVVFAIMVFVVHGVLSYRTYHIHRQLTITILSLGSLLLLLNIIVSNALLVLR